MGLKILYQGFLITLITLASYFIGHRMESGVWEITQSNDGITMAFLTMSMAEIFHSYNMRTKNSIFTLRTHNWLLTGTMVVALLLTAAVIFIPSLAALFGFATISLTEYLVALGLALSIIPLVEMFKLFSRLFRKNK